MKLKTPSPKVLAFLIIVVILITTTIVSTKFLNKNTGKIDAPINLTIQNNLNEKLDPKDTDGDGLSDWQEEIWGTDKNNVDSDGDGTSDGEEVNQNRSPIVAGPNDKILDDREVTKGLIKESLARSKNNTDPNSLTTILSKNLLLRLAQLEQSGQYNTQNATNLGKDLANQAFSEVKIPDKYPENIFLTFEGNDKEKLKIYAQKILDIQTNELLKLSPDNKDLDPIIKIYKNIAFQMSVMPVPKDILSVHAKIANGYFIAAEALINLKLSDTDPILGILSIPVYKKVSEEQPLLYKQLENYLKTNDIILIKENE